MKREKLRRRVHVSWHIAWICVGLILGIAATALFNTLMFAYSLWLVLAVVLIGIALAKRTAAFVLLSVTAGLLLGLWRGSIEQLALQQYRPFYEKVVTVQGRVTEDPSQGKSGDVRMQLSKAHVNGQAMHGQIWVSAVGKTAIKRSDIVTVRGKLGEGFGNLPASMFRAQLVSVKPPAQKDVALQVRDWFASGIRTGIPEPQASLGVGYLVGQRSTLPPEFDEQLRVAGLTHAVVASGYNLTILVGFARRSLLKISKYLATLAGVLMIGGFVMVTGLSPSMTRAGLVTGLSLAAWYYGRRIHPFVLLPFAAAITTLINPAYVWGDIGWYLSFLAFAGILFLAPLIKHYFWGEGEPNAISGILIETSSAQLATMPIILFSFGQYSSYALLANMLVLPLVPLTMLLTFGAGIAGVAVPGLAHIFGLPATAILHYMTSVVGWIANLPGAQGEVNFTTVALVGSYGLLLLAGLFLWRRTAHSFRQGQDRLIGELIREKA